MPRVELKGVHRVTKKLSRGNSVEYHYAWRGGPRFWRSDSPVPKNGPHYFAAYKDALDEASPAKGKFREIILAYLDSREFKGLKPRSQSDIKQSIRHPEGIDQRFGDAPIGAFNKPEIRRIAYKWRDGFSSARTADTRIAHLSAIVSWAVDRSYLHTHHLLKTTKVYKVDRSEIIWTDDEIEAFVAGTPNWISRILVAATETGLRPGDLARLNRGHIQATKTGQRILIRTGKRDRMVSIPVTPKMAELIEATPSGQFQILVGARGNPITNPNRLGRKVGEYKKKLDLRDELHLYDARGTAATRLFQANASLREIALQMGWSVQHAAKMIEVYVALNPDVSDDILIRLGTSK